MKKQTKHFLKLFFIVFALIAIFYTACKKKGKEPEPETKSKFTIMTNSSDPLLIRADEGNGKTIEVFGTRNAKGVPLNVTDIIVAAAGDTTYYKLNDQKQITTIQAPNGIQFSFTWTSPKIAVVTVLSTDGTTQITTEVDFSGKKLAAKALSTNSQPSNIRQNKPTIFSFNNTLMASPTAIPTAASSTIEVRQCESLADVSQVFVTANSTSGDLLGTFPAKNISKGVWGVNIPSNIAPVTDVGEICSSIAGVLDLGCIAADLPQFQLLCPAISSAVAVTGVGAPIAAPIFAACEFSVIGLTAYCKTFGASPAPGAPSLTEMLCNSNALNRKITHDIMVRAWTPGLPNAISSPSYRVTAGAALPNFSLNLGANTQIRKFTLTPPSPAQGQSYNATVDVFCIKSGSRIEMSIIGTDGYKNTETYNINTTQGNGAFTLKVPGASTGVKDIVTLKITLPDGKVITREASLVFG